MTDTPAPAPETVTRADVFEARTAWPMFVLSLLFLVASAWLLSGDEPDARVRAVLSLVVAVLWIAFIAQFVIRFLLSRHRRVRFLQANWFELLSLAVPYLRPFVIVVYVWRLPTFQRSAAALRARYVTSVLSFALLFVYVGSTAVWLIEKRDPSANIVNLGDAIWWGFTTITTVGYGDYTPVTTAGRVIAVLMMVGGLAVVGVASATIISLLSDQIQRYNHAARAQRAALARLESEHEGGHSHLLHGVHEAMSTLPQEPEARPDPPAGDRGD